MSLQQIAIQGFFLAVAFGLIYLSVAGFSEEDWQHIVAMFKEMNYLLVVIGFLPIVLSHICRSERWLLLVDGEQSKKFETKRSFNAFAALMIGYLANMAIPRLGEVLRCVVLSRYEQKNTPELIGTIIVERAFDVLCLLLVFMITLSVESDVILSYILNLFTVYVEQKNWLLLLVIVIGVLISLFLLIKFIILRNQRLHAWMLDFKKGVFSFMHIKKKKTFIFYTLLMWFLYISGIRLSFYIFPATEMLTWGIALSIISVGSVAMIITQGGIGAYQFMVMQILSLYGVLEYVGFTLGWFLWMLMAFVAIFAGGICYIILPYVNKQGIVKLSVD